MPDTLPPLPDVPVPTWVASAVRGLVDAAMEAAITPSCAAAHDVRHRSIELFTLDVAVNADETQSPEQTMLTAWGALAWLANHYMGPTDGTSPGMVVYDGEGNIVNPDDVARLNPRLAGAIGATRFLTAWRAADQTTYWAIFHSFIPTHEDDQRWVWVLDNLQTIAGDAAAAAMCSGPDAEKIPLQTRAMWQAKRAHMAAAHTPPPAVQAQHAIDGGYLHGACC